LLTDFYRLWDVDDKKLVQEFEDHNGIIYDTDFHPDGTCLASCSADKKIKVFDFRSKRLI
jgi:WD40 repeat protein